MPRGCSLGTTSQGEMTMTIHRPSWERSMSMRVWTRGQKRSLVRVTAPRKDAGNGTLMIDDSMWTYSPKVNRVMKVPSSMMGQSWLGSDFSNKDVSRADTIVDQYDHTLLEKEQSEGHTVYVHCFAGRGRTGTVIGCWLARHGSTDPLADLDALRTHLDTPSPETADQCRFVADRA